MQINPVSMKSPLGGCKEKTGAASRHPGASMLGHERLQQKCGRHQGGPTAARAPLSVSGGSACLHTTGRSGQALIGLMHLPQPYFRKVFIRAGAPMTAIAKAAKVFPLCYISLFSLAYNCPKFHLEG